MLLRFSASSRRRLSLKGYQQPRIHHRRLKELAADSTGDADLIKPADFHRPGAGERPHEASHSPLNASAPETAEISASAYSLVTASVE
jgi:hypothetical protein